MASAISIDSITVGARIALLALVTAAPLTARAQASPTEKQAQALQVEGLRLMQKGDSRHALEKFEEAYRLVPSPRILFNRGKAHHTLGDDPDALADFERFLDEAPFAPKESRDEATRVVESLRPRLAYLDIQTDDVGSDVSVDGRAIGTAPLARPVVVARGKHEVRVAKAGMNDEVRSVSVIPGQKLRVLVRLTAVAEKPAASPPPAPFAPTPAAAAPAPAPAPSNSVPASPPSAAPAAKPAEPPAPPPEGGRPWQITAGWVAAGAGALFLGAGIAAQVSSSSKNADFNAVKNAPNSTGMCNKLLPNDGGPSCAGLLEAAHQRQVFAIAGYVASGVAFAGSLALFLTAPSQTAARHEVAAACSPTTAGVSCALELSF